MKYEVKVEYNEQGRRLTGRSEWLFTLEYKYQPTNERLIEDIYKEVPETLISGFDVDCNEQFTSLQPGDYVHINYCESDYDGTTIWSSTGTVKVVDDKAVTVVDTDTLKEYRFDFNGNLITRRKKDIYTIEVFTEDEAKYYAKDMQLRAAWKKIRDFVEYCGDEVPYGLDVDDLERIYERLNIEEHYDHFGM